MGYPMTYARVVARNHLDGDYWHNLPLGKLPADGGLALCGDNLIVLPDGKYCANQALAGDMRRLEKDQRDERHLKAYARIAGIAPEQAKMVLDAFFAGGDQVYGALPDVR